MKNNLDNITFEKSKEKEKLIEVECQNCGKLVKVLSGYTGCVFCGDCTQPEIYQADASEFKSRYV